MEPAVPSEVPKVTQVQPETAEAVIFPGDGSIRVVTTRGEAQADAQADGRTAETRAQRFRMRVYAGEGGIKAGTSRLVLSAFYVPPTGETEGHTYRASAHIEVDGEAYPVTWAGQPFGVVPAGAAEFVSDPIAQMPEVAPSTEMWLFLERVYELGGGPIYSFSKGASPDIEGEASHQAPEGTPSGVGTPGPISAANGWSRIANTLCPPFVIVGEQVSQAPAFVVAGASIEKRQDDTWGDGANGAGGYMRQGLNPARGKKYSYIMLAKASESIEEFLRDSAKRSAYFKYASVPIIAYGGNDYTGGRTAAATLADIERLATTMKTAAGVEKCGYVRLAPKTNSEDNWQTPTGQKVRPGFAAFRDEIDQGVQAAGMVLIDVTQAYENPDRPGVWQNGFTDDGTHPTSTAHRIAGEVLQLALKSLI